MRTSAMWHGSSVERLAAAGCVAPEEEARELAAGAPDDHVLEEWLRRRERGEPLAWITGTTTFCGRTIRVDPGVYVPRLQSEELARRASAFLPDRGRALDLCTGCGAIAVTMSETRPSAIVIGVDLDPRAAANARRNGVGALRGNLGDALRSKGFDIVTCVAPYVPTRELRLLPSDVTRYEPSLALDGGDDGLAVLRGVVVSAARLLRPGGRLLVEVGGSQDRGLRSALSDSGFGNVETWFDEAGDLRGLLAEFG
ncbi:MAG: N5-glutamine methyltransferase family protein [Actinomycetota bacterium]